MGHPIALASRTLRLSERKPTTTELDAFAIVPALESFRVCVEGSPTLPCGPLSEWWARNNLRKAATLARWALRLHNFAFGLERKNRRCNAVAEALSQIWPTRGVPPEPHGTVYDRGQTSGNIRSCACQGCCPNMTVSVPTVTQQPQGRRTSRSCATSR